MFKKLVRASGLSIAILAACSSVVMAAPQKFLIGSYTDKTSEGVYLLSLQDKPLKLINHGVVAKMGDPTYLALSKDNQQLYTVAEKKLNTVTHFQWQPGNETFALKQKVSLEGKGACHLSLNPQEDKLVTAHYGSGHVNVLSLNDKSHKMEDIVTFKNTGKGLTKRQKSPHMHFAAWDQAGKFLYTVDLGTDEIKVFDNKAALSPIHSIKVKPGDGPRHLVFHPNKPVVFVLNELSNTVIVYQQDTVTGELTFKQRVSAVPEGIDANNGSSAIKISKDGRFLYAGVRSLNAIAVFSVDQDNEQLALIQSAPALGDWPRDFSLSGDEKYILVANQRSGSVNVLRRDIQTGLLSSTKAKVDVSSASFVGNFNPK